ncbi:hypothetical protein FZC78_11500 [Rossellomorea vietnamensis]|uniref:Cytochrome c oxidase subunit 4 n=1 Tax=Rossellomorea vietnamensis TaxID=218284 RepID=A0A5D4NSM3_9BACI|nr:hypothetical protein [Rossellomorea vietnamensis]TYS16611.1 hypothetical protein FZC78_11500 [Rossellomorea vietnamensis]
MFSMLNLGSLILGCIAWILPFVCIMGYRKKDLKTWGTSAVLSISACAISLCFQIIYQNHLVNIEDWSAIMDTSGALVFVSVVLVSVTILLNAVGYFLHRMALSFKSS